MDIEQFETQAIQLKGKYEKLIIVDGDSFAAMGSHENTAKVAIAAIKKHMQPVIEDAHQKHKRTLAILKKHVDPLEEIRVGARTKRLDYQREEERIAQEVQRKAEEEARKLAEQKRQEEIEEAEAFEPEASVEAVKATPIEIPTVKVQATAKVSGARNLWHAEVTDIRALALAVSQGHINENFIMPNLPLLNQYAREAHDQFRIPGVKAVSQLT